MIDGSRGEVVRYTYDAWGKVLSTTGTMASSLGALNPFRYRGYVYDTETGLYYLRSRYYNPNWNRFVNADTHIGNVQLLSINIFCYCRNSAILYNDFSGHYAVNSDNINLKKRLNNPRNPLTILTSDEFVLFLKKMVDEKWQYDYKKGDNGKGMRYKHVDCVSVYRYIMQHYYNADGYRYALPKKGNDALDSVPELAERGVYDLQPIESDYSNLIPGMAIFLMGDNEKYKHVAYYIGNGKAIESNKKTTKYSAGVHEIDITDYNFTECGFLLGIGY